MSLNRYAKRRDKTEPDIVKGLEKCGCLVMRQDFPDLCVKHAGRFYLLEVEGITRNRKRSAKQLEFLSLWEIPRVQSFEDASRAIGLTGAFSTTPAISVPCTSKPGSAATSSVAGP